MRSPNRNDMPIHEADTLHEMSLDDFEYKDHFSFLCTLIPETENERVVIQETNEPYIERKGILYLFVLENRILKVGSSTVSFKERVSSYNCGKQAFRDNGTCSTTNYFVLQSLLNINKPIEVYAFFPESIEMDVFGTTEEISLPAKRYEKRILTELKDSNQLPVMCTQQ